MSKTAKIIIAVCLTVLLAGGGFLLGSQYMDKVPLQDPIHQTRITLTVNGISAKACAELAGGDIVANRLVENLMLLCTPDDLQQGTHIQSKGSDTVIVEMAMEQEGTMVYFADELAWILQEEANKDSGDVSVTIVDQENLTITYEEQPSMMTACLCAALGAVLGVLIDVLLFCVKQKPAQSMGKD